MRLNTSHMSTQPPQTALHSNDLTPPPPPSALDAKPRELAAPEHIRQSLASMIETSTQQRSSGAMLLVHFSNLAMIVNAYGHDMSEQVINDITSRIQFILSPKDQIFRVQRDQIMIALAESYPDDTENLALRITNTVQHYGRDTYLSSALHVMAHISSVHFPSESESADDLMDKAFISLNSNNHSIYRPYSAAKLHADQARQQMGLASYLFTAYQEQRLRMAWQPIISVKDQNIGFYESLLRVKGSNGKISSAGALIPVAEKMGLIDTIDEMVMELVVRELRASPQAKLAFNVSNITTENHAWLDKLHERIDETPEIASRMIVEITETATQRDLRRVAYFVACLQSMGCQVALDDFGSGYTSFRQLKALSIDYVKIDGVFIRDIAENADSRFFVKTMLDFIHGFGLKSVAEFVENGEIAKILMDMGVDYLQGYYLGKPENTRSWLNEGEYKPD